MTISVIIPNYNHAAFLRQRIDSILSQTFRDFELIILDDCSTDGSRDIINQYKTRHPEIIIEFNSTKAGSPFSQWNKGVALAKGEFIWIAESDDSAEPEFLEKTVQVLAEDQNAGLVFTDSKIRNEEKETDYLASERRALFSNLRMIRIFNDDRDKKKSMSMFFENPIVNVSSVLFRKNTYLEAGGADSSMRFCGDWLLYIKVFLLSGIRYIPEPLNNFRLHADSSYQSHYGSNIFLKEKMKISTFILRNSRITALMIYLVIIKTLKALILRLLFLFKVNEILKIEIPRVPRNVTKLINT